MIAGDLVVAGAITVTAGDGAAATAATATTVGTAVMADGDPTNEVNAIADTVNSACGGDYCASEAQDLSNKLADVIPNNPGDAFSHIIKDPDHLWLENGIDTLEGAWPHIETVVHNNAPTVSSVLETIPGGFKQEIFGLTQIGDILAEVGVRGVSIPSMQLFKVTTAFITRIIE